jgi:hypothetical protein
MAAIDYDTCSIDDIIAHSLKRHTQLLVDRLRSHAWVHAEFADAYENHEVTRSELGLADRLHGFANAVECGDYTIPDDFDVRREAFSCAASLQDLHPIMQEATAEREDARTVGPGRSGRDRGPNEGLARALAVVTEAQQADGWAAVPASPGDRPMNCGDRDGPTDVTGDKPAFVERRRPGRVDYTNPALIALLRRPDGDVSKGDMTAIDYATCGIDDVIAHSLKRHTQPLADRLRSHARVHAEFADAYGDREVTRNELVLADRLHAFANASEQGDTTIPNDDDVRREAFGCAAWLQDLHPIMQEVIVEREDAQNVGPGRSGQARGGPNEGLARALAASNRAFLRRG